MAMFFSGHFTQMVWKGSREFGIGKAITRDGKVIIVGQYRPPGNVIDHFEGNVSKRDDGYMPPPPPEKESSQVTRVVRSTEYESGPSREVKAAEVNETIKKVSYKASFTFCASHCYEMFVRLAEIPTQT